MKVPRIVQAMESMDDALISGAEAYKPPKKRPVWVKWGVMAACLCLVLCGALGVNRLLSDRTDTVTLHTGEKIVFEKTDAVSFDSALAFDVTTRSLTEEEAAAVFAGLPASAQAIFRSSDLDAGAQQELIGFDGRIGNVKAVISTSDVSLRDTEIAGTEETSEVNGVSIIAGYWITKPNSKGEQNVIYYAAFALGACKVYLENAGAKDEREAIKDQLAEVLQKVIENGEPDVAAFLDSEAGAGLDGDPDGYDPLPTGPVSDEEASEQDPAAN